MTEKKPRSGWTLAVAAQVRAERAARGLTQQQVMDLSGFAKSTYLRMESGERVIDADQLAQLCKAYGMRVSQFFARVEERYSADPGLPQDVYGLAAAEGQPERPFQSQES